jgi:hypothetical protein
MTTRRTATTARALGCFASLALLSACAGGNHISATQEAAHYEQHARRNYAPPGSARDPWGPYITEASSRFDIPERWIREVMRVESGGRTEMNGAPITSGAGAMGLMQVMPATYDELRSRYTLGDDPYDPHNSILAGTAYIRELYDLYGSPGFLAAYNGGPGRLDDYLTRNRALPDETRRYVAKIGPYITDSFPNKRSTAEMYAMNSMPSSIPAGPRYSPAADTSTAAYVPPASAPVSAVAAYVPPPAPTAPAPAAAAPVEFAYAPPASDDAAFDPPPGWRPAGMPKSEVAAYVPPPAAAPVSTASTYVPLPAPSPPVEVAAMPEPPRSALSKPRMQTASAYEPIQPQTLRHEGFHLVSPAQAAPLPAFHGAPGQWAIQVGAFGNEGLAHIAVGQAREQAGAVLASAHPLVAGVREPHGTLFRARLTGLSRESAAQACDRLRGRTNCIVLSPAAQS